MTSQLLVNNWRATIWGLNKTMLIYLIQYEGCLGVIKTSVKMDVDSIDSVDSLRPRWTVDQTEVFHWSMSTSGKPKSGWRQPWKPQSGWCRPWKPSGKLTFSWSTSGCAFHPTGMFAELWKTSLYQEWADNICRHCPLCVQRTLHLFFLDYY